MATYVNYMNNTLSFLWDYAENLLKYEKEYYMAKERLSFGKVQRVKDSPSTIAHELKIAEAYRIAAIFYNKLKDIAIRYQNGEDVERDLQIYNDQLNDAQLPIFEKTFIKLKTVVNSSESNNSDNTITGGAANSGTDINKDMLETSVMNRFKKGQPMNFEQAAGGKVNPNIENLDDKPSQYYDNCVICVLAFEARLRGYKVHAAGQLFEGKLNELAKHPFWAWLDTETGEKVEGQILNANTKEDLLKTLENIVKSGERYNFIYYQSIELDGVTYHDGHIISIDRNEDDELRFYDPQIDRLRVGKEELLGFIDVQILLSNPNFKPKILRVDNKAINPEFASEALIAD